MYHSQQYSHPHASPLEQKRVSTQVERESSLLCVTPMLMGTVSFRVDRSVVTMTAKLPASPQLSACGLFALGWYEV